MMFFLTIFVLMGVLLVFVFSKFLGKAIGIALGNALTSIFKKKGG